MDVCDLDSDGDLDLAFTGELRLLSDECCDQEVAVTLNVTGE